MHPIDLTIVGLYLAVMLGIGLYFFRRQQRTDEYFVGDRKMGAWHIGFSVVATDVGGGFSIGLGGLGFAVGLSGSWLLFTGLVGAWLSAVLLLPRVKPLGERLGWLTFPDYLAHRFDGRLRVAGALISGIGYAAFVGAQILAGAKLGAAAFDLSLGTAVWIMAVVVVAYTSFGGLQAVVLTDTVQWIVLLGGLALFGVPCGWMAVGGWEGLRSALPAPHFSLTAVGPAKLGAWALTIIPIWFVGNTLYQRIFATRDLKTARRAWYLAGLLEYPAMAFLGALLGMFAAALFPEAEPEMGLPLMLRHILPVGVAGLVLAAYFSAIMSTADSCLLASVANVVHDLYRRHLHPEAGERRLLWLSRVLTVVTGLLSVSLAFALPNVLDAILLAYAFLVCGLFVPTVAGLLWRRATARGALASMVTGCLVVLAWQIAPWLLDLASRAGVGDAATRAPQPLIIRLAAQLREHDPVWVALPLTLVVMVLVSLTERRPANLTSDVTT